MLSTAQPTRACPGPKHMGKNGDRVPVVPGPAEVFIVQHHIQIHESVPAQVVTSPDSWPVPPTLIVCYGAIDGKDSDPLVAANPTRLLRRIKLPGLEPLGTVRYHTTGASQKA